ncbi:hypothetical protein CTA2_8266 [Colletotrichum tanaceti]|uniref:DUF6594 domain-containing protein n=1 Tax=Colletotrichum tanaceti TaxID=1306861 RepID=A0A4U6X7V2_9PEZI|nr:hypothetical protein CTA2_8266 [Colletotrichum tanaceti]TKW49587.1 hypothetical protein CTA1_8419 [Colletotrichum tanaceti]
MPLLTSSDDEGYGKLAKLFAEAQEVAIFRKFDQLNMFNLLRLQAEIHELEEDLREIRAEDRDSNDSNRRSYGLNFRVMRENAQDGDSEQLEILAKIGLKLNEYNQALQNVAFLYKASQPSDAEVDFLRIWLGRDKMGNRFLRNAGVEATVWDDKYRADLLTIGGSSGTSDRLSRLMNGRLLNWYHFAIGRFTKSGKRTNDEMIGIRDYDSRKIQRVSDVAVGALSASIPTVAILVLYFVHNMTQRISLVIVFTFIFSVAFSTITGAKKAEVFAATAAFAAVEVVYIGSVSSNDTVCVCSPTQA